MCNQLAHTLPWLINTWHFVTVTFVFFSGCFSMSIKFWCCFTWNYQKMCQVFQKVTQYCDLWLIKQVISCINILFVHSTSMCFCPMKPRILINFISFHSDQKRKRCNSSLIVYSVCYSYLYTPDRMKHLFCLGSTKNQTPCLYLCTSNDWKNFWHNRFWLHKFQICISPLYTFFWCQVP